MKIYDISQEVFNCKVYPGDMRPSMEAVNRIDKGNVYNLTNFSMCAHNGTHIDAPYHFINDGKTIEQLALSKLVGYCYVTNYLGDLTAEDAVLILDNAKTISVEASKRILIKGEAVVSLEAAIVFADAGIDLLGVESQSVGPEDAPMAVHKALLEEEIVLLEGLVLKNVMEGMYLLNAAPLSLAGIDGAPCRAILIDLE